MRALPGASSILPFVRMSYGGVSTYTWDDDDGLAHRIEQAEGGEQGDPLMPLLFALGIHEAIESVAGRRQEGEEIAAFLDDIYVLCLPDRVSAIYSILADSL